MAKSESRRWTNLRTAAGGVPPIKGSQPKKRPGTRRKGGKPKPWYWIHAKFAGECERCSRSIAEGDVVAHSRPNRIRCESCVEETGLNVRTSAKFEAEKEER